MKFHVIDNDFQFQKCLNCVILLLSIFEFIIKKKLYTWNQHLNKISSRYVDLFLPIIPIFVDICSNVIIEIPTLELR